MIHYTLQCDHGHSFDGWFRSSAAFDDQQASGALSCPICGTPNVTRALMAPAIVSDRAERAPLPAPVTEPAPSAALRDPAPQGQSPPNTSEAPSAPAITSPAPTPSRAEFVEAVRALRAAVIEHGTNVGSAFPEEARRIHYGEAEPRGIYGEANLDDAQSLLEEGINVLPIPTLPEDRN
ncbi:MAG: DUF1178 family protein [Pseudomonadota bacterium]